MNWKTKSTRPWIGLALAMLTAGAQAGFTTYSTQAAFSGAATVLGTDSFNDLAAGDLAALLSRGAGGITYTISAPSGLFGVASSGTALSNADRREVITFTGFSGSLTAIGASFFGTNESGAVLANQSIWVTVTDTSLAQSATLLTSNSASSFFGVASTLPILSLTVSVDAGNLLAAWPTVDNLALATAVPEPSSVLLLAAGAALVAGAVRRQRRG